MAGSTSPATVVVCVPWPRPGAGLPARRAGVTWVADLDTLAADGGAMPAAAVALALEPEWMASRHTLRTALVRARHAVPGLEAAVLRVGTLAHHAVLAEEGIRAVLVNAFADVGRGRRRPAPAGWRCRNVAWGLWEVMASAPSRAAAWAWLPGLPAARRGALHVAAPVTAGSVARLLGWADRETSRGRAAAVTLGDLPAILEGRRPGRLAASVLAAA